MQLPKDLQHFSVPTLVVTADQITAKFWLAGGENIEELDGVSAPRDLMSDAETSFVNVDTHGTNAPEPKTEVERLKHYAKLVADRVTNLLRHDKVGRVHLVADARIVHSVTEHMPKELQPLLGRSLHENLMQQNILEVLRRLHA